MPWQYLWFVEAFRPRCWVLENVRGLMSAALCPMKGRPPRHDDERPRSLVRRFVADLPDEYRVDGFEVNAVNYGCPQVRERVLLVGNRHNRVAEFPQPTHGPTGSGLLPYRTLRDALAGLRDDGPVILDFSERKKRVLALVPPGGNWRDLPDEIARSSMGSIYGQKGGHSGWWRRLSWGLPCPAVLTMPNHASTSLCHPDETRALSLAECAAVQVFASEWRFVGTPAECYRMVGNGVPVRLAQVCGEAVAGLLDRTHRDGIGVGSHPRFRVVNLSSHVRFGRRATRLKIGMSPDLRGTVIEERVPDRAWSGGEAGPR